ncbi:RNA polymerase sigma factor [Flexithrix dorotheae]|uniref:RNA polymerase sigma factor n=1 Tax=Flexithrix dorotheae TaxID=70993 RepID=UPI00037D1305|nr:sigma-70 family RNA polymerase sigma factor [Flexithrix dorotheae]
MGKVNYSSEEDEKLWEAFRRGSEEVFSKIYKQHFPSLFNYGIKLCEDEDLVKDNLQELFLTIWKNRQNLGDAYSIRFYLLKSFKRKLLRALKNHKRSLTNRIDENHYNFYFEFSVEAKEMDLERSQEQFLLLKNGINTLTSRQKEAIYLKFYNGLDYGEIAEIMSINIQSTRSLVYEGIKGLKNIFKKK